MNETSSRNSIQKEAVRLIYRTKYRDFLVTFGIPIIIYSCERGLRAHLATTDSMQEIEGS